MCRFAASLTHTPQVHKTRYLLRPAAMELFFADGSSCLIVLNVQQRDKVPCVRPGVPSFVLLLPLWPVLSSWGDLCFCTFRLRLLSVESVECAAAARVASISCFNRAS